MDLSYKSVSGTVSAQQAPLWVHRFATFTAFMTLVLLAAGALVTSTGSGLSVPDWPLSYGKFFPPMVGGIFFEHGHRMIAGVVAILSFVLTISLWRREPRLWVRLLALAAFSAVVVQAVLGGLTVLMLLPPSVSVAHACTAQIFFCLNVILAMVTSPGWERPQAPLAEEGTWISLQTLTTITAMGFFVQLVLGAIMRHIGAGLAIPDFPLSFGGLVPREFTFAIAIHYAHRTFAFVMLALSFALSARVFRKHSAHRGLVGLAGFLLLLVVFQISLGASIIWLRRPVAITSLHLVVGALCLATTVAMCCRSLRLQRSSFSSRTLFQIPLHAPLEVH